MMKIERKGGGWNRCEDILIDDISSYNGNLVLNEWNIVNG